MIELQGVTRVFRNGDVETPVLHGIDLTIRAGEFVAIVGASGSGKSTLMNILGLLDRFDEGSYLLDGEDMSDLSEARAAQLRSRYIGFVFQSFHLIPFKTAIENVALPLYYQGVGRRERNRIAAEYLERVGLGERGGHLPRELSGGQQQRVAIARSLVTQPKMLLADEPTGALDSGTSYEVMKTLQAVQAEGVAVIIITHENAIAAMTDRIIHLIDGNIEWDRPNDRRDPPQHGEAEVAEAVASVAAT